MLVHKEFYDYEITNFVAIKTKRDKTHEDITICLTVQSSYGVPWKFPIVYNLF